MTVPTRADIDRVIRERLADDPGFRARLLADPTTTLGELAGTEIPQFVTVTVHEETLTDVHLVIPALPAEEISEDDLEMVAGGVCWADTSGTPNCV